MEVSEEALVVMLGEMASSTDLDSSKYSSENLED